MSDDDIVIHVVDQIHESDSFSEETMKTWKETWDNKKMWIKCQTFFEAAYIPKKWYMDAKDQTSESMNKSTEADFNMYLDAIEMKATQENKEHSEHVQHITEQNAMLMALVNEQLKQTKELLEAMNKVKQEPKSNEGTNPEFKRMLSRIIWTLIKRS